MWVGARHETLAFLLSPSVGRTTCTHCLGVALRGLKETNEQVRVLLLSISSLHTKWGLQHPGPMDLMYLGLILPPLVSVELRENVWNGFASAPAMTPGQRAVFGECALCMAVKFPPSWATALASFSPKQIFWGWCSIAIKHQDLMSWQDLDLLTTRHFVMICLQIGFFFSLYGILLNNKQTTRQKQNTVHFLHRSLLLWWL